MPIRPEPIPGARVRALRERLGLTQEEMATRLGTTGTTVFRWEHDLRHPTGLYRAALERLEREGEPAA